MYDDYAWQNLREESLKFMKNLEETIIKKWLNEIGAKDKNVTIGYYRNSWKREMEIYTTIPGCLIGKAGIGVEKLKELLTEEFGGEWTIKFVEIRGGFVNI